MLAMMMMNTYVSIEDTKRGPTYRTTRHLPHGAANATVRIRIPGHEGAATCALEVYHGHVAISVFGVGILNRRHAQLESNEPERFTCRERGPVLGGVKWTRFEVEGVKVVEV